MSMNPEGLFLLQWEFKTSKEHKADRLHEIWRNVVHEYRGGAPSSHGHHHHHDAGHAELFDSIEHAVSNPTHANLLSTDGRIPNVNLIVRKLVALLNLKNVEFTIDNKTPNFEAIADLLQHSVEQVLQEIGLRKINRKTLLDVALFGTAAWSVGFESLYVPSERAWAEPIPRGVDGPTIDDVKKMPYGQLTEYGLRETGRQKPTIYRIRPHDLFFPLGTVVLEEAHKIYIRHTRWVADVWHDSRYTAEFRRQFKGVNVDRHRGSYPAGESIEGIREAQKGEVIQCIDIPSKQFCVFAENVDVPAIEWTPLPFKLKGLPIKVLTLIDDPESIWGIPYAWLILPASRAVNEVRAKELLSAQKDGKRINFWSGELTSQEEIDEKVTAAKDGAHIVLDKPPEEGLDMRKVFQQVDFGGVNPVLGDIKRDIQSDIGFTSQLDDPTRAEPTKSRTTATEIDARRTQQGVTVADYREIFEEFLEDSIGDVISIMLQNWGQEEMVKVVGDDPRVWFWVPVERNKLMTDFTLRVTAGSTEKQDKTVYRQQWLELLPRITDLADRIDAERLQAAQFPQLPPSPVNREEMLRITLEQFDMRAADKIMRRRDPAELVMRLIQQHDMNPTKTSPELQRQVDLLFAQQRQALGAQTPLVGSELPQQGQQPPGVVSFEERTGIPGPANIQNDTLASSGARTLSTIQGAAQ